MPWKDRIYSLVLAAGFLAGAANAQQLQVQNQIETPDRKYLFREESSEQEKVQKKRFESSVAIDPARSTDTNFNAPHVEFDKEKNEVKGSGGVLVSADGIQAQADQGRLNLETKDSSLSGNVVVSDPKGSIVSDQAELNVDAYTGTFSGASFTIEEGGYNVRSQTAEKLSETKYHLLDSSLTTCACQDGEVPWSIDSGECNITQEGYAHCYDTTLDFAGVPFIYTPYLGFPVKTERTSGLLVPQIGSSSRNGFQARIPVFVVIDESTDMTVAPFIETKSRIGSGFDFRKTFSRQSGLESRLIYSDERARDGQLQGTNIDGLYDPTFDEDRFGGFMKQRFSAPPGSEMKYSLISDIHYVSDDLFQREIQDDDILEREARYATSQVLAQVGLGEYMSATAMAEYNQSIETDDDTTLQRLPELTLQGTRSFRPFGFNPYGLKLVSRGNVTATNFTRDEGFDGWRTNYNPSIGVPFHYKNFFSSSFNLSLHHTRYNLDETQQTSDPTRSLDDSNDRTIPIFDYQVGTAVERVYDLEPGNFLTTLTSLGSENQGNTLKRVKHVIEPIVAYRYVPDISQDDLPLFDSFDRIRLKSLFTYGVRTSILGRFLPATSDTEDISELTPRPEDLPSIDLGRPIDEFGAVAGEGGFGAVNIRRGEIREIASLDVRQSYDYFEDRYEDDFNKTDSNRLPWSDIGVGLGLYPTRTFGMRFGTNYNSHDSELSSWDFSTSLRTDRGDALRTRFNYVRNSLSQIENNLEVVLGERLRVGYYTRYDDKESEFIENWGLLRLTSACDCWHFDVGLRDTINPDKQSILFQFTFGGLGDLSQDVLYNERENS